MSGPTWTRLPGAPETQLPAAVLERFAAGEAGAPAAPPWRTRVSAVLWWHRATPAAVAALPHELRGLPTLPLTLAAAVRYHASPVGSYREIFASPVLIRAGGLPAISVPFIAVDSLASVAGGRAGWGLPKTLAGGSGDGVSDLGLEGETWSVGVRMAPCGPRLPLAGLLPLLQPLPDGSLGRSSVRLAGLARVGRARVAVQGPSLPAWLTAGRHPAVLITSARMSIGPPRPDEGPAGGSGTA